MKIVNILREMKRSVADATGEILEYAALLYGSQVSDIQGVFFIW